MRVDRESASAKGAPPRSFEVDGRSVTLWRLGSPERSDGEQGGTLHQTQPARGQASAAEAGPERHEAPRPLVYLHVYDGNGADVAKACEEIGCAPCTLVAIKPACWNDDMTPWECPGLFAGDAPFAGHAERELAVLEREIIPRVEGALLAPTGPAAQTRPPRIIAGYSLAGLFALWAPFRSPLFSRVASASGSLWYPDFARLARTAEMARLPECAFISLGKKEAKTPSRLLRNVAQATDEVVDALRERGVPTRFTLNPGNHFAEPALRMAHAIAWCVSRPNVADDDEVAR